MNCVCWIMVSPLSIPPPGAGAVIHTHSKAAVMATLLYPRIHAMPYMVSGKSPAVDNVGSRLLAIDIQIWAVKIALKSWHHHGNINTNVYVIYTRGSVQLELNLHMQYLTWYLIQNDCFGIN